MTQSGTISVTLYVNETPLIGGTVTSTSSFEALPVLDGDTFISSSDSAIVYLDIMYSGGTAQAKEVLVDDVVVTRLD